MIQGVSKAKMLRNLLRAGKIIVAPGVFNGITAKMAERQGFKAAYFSGGALANSMVLPDLGVFTLTELTTCLAPVVSRTNLPLIVDVDTGFGETINVVRTVTELERLDVAAVHIEDQMMPKKCGHLSGKRLIDVESMVKKIVAATEARRTDMVIIARTDARDVEGLDAMIERARVYARAGADMIFPEALVSREEFAEVAKKVHTPLVANMTEFGRTPYITAREYERMGYKVVIFPMTAFRIMLKAVQDAFEELRRHGSQRDLLGRMMTREQLYELIGYHDALELDGRIVERAEKILRSSDDVT